MNHLFIESKRDATQRLTLLFRMMWLTLVCVSCVVLPSGVAHGKFRLVTIFSDHMVLQRDSKVAIRGNADAVEKLLWPFRMEMPRL